MIIPILGVNIMSKNTKIIGLTILIAVILLLIFTLYAMSGDNTETVKSDICLQTMTQHYLSQMLPECLKMQELKWNYMNIIMVEI